MATITKISADTDHVKSEDNVRSDQ